MNTSYEVDDSGARKLSTLLKPPNIDSKAWVKLSEERKLEEIAKYNSASAGVAITCAPLGVAALRSHVLAAQVLGHDVVDNNPQEYIGLDNFCISKQHGHSEIAPEDQVPPWDHGVNVVRMRRLHDLSGR